MSSAKPNRRKGRPAQGCPKNGSWATPCLASAFLPFRLSERCFGPERLKVSHETTHWRKKSHADKGPSAYADPQWCSDLNLSFPTDCTRLNPGRSIAPHRETAILWLAQIDRVHAPLKIAFSLACIYGALRKAIWGEMNNGRNPTGKGQTSDPTVVACVVFQTRDPERLVELLRQALTGIADRVPPAPATVPVLGHSDDPWLRHAEAAEYLGVSKSTLYQYACQQKIECRKLAGRLEYRRSILDRFKDHHIRPASRWLSSRSIIPAALGSGK